MLLKILQYWRRLPQLALLVISACDSQQEPAYDQLSINEEAINVSLPHRLRTIQNIDLTALRAIATINGVETELQQNSEGRFSGQITVPAQSEFTVRIDFIELYSGQQLTLARAEKSVTTNTGNASLSLLREDYDYSSFDSDGDRASNILERQYNTNPLDSAQLPELVTVEVFAELPAVLVAAGFTNYQLIGGLAGEAIAVDASTGQFRHTFTVLRQANLTASMRLVEGVTGQSLTIGQQDARQIPESQISIDNSALIVFNRDSWNLTNDQDGDGVSDADELVAGTDILNGPLTNRIPYTITFEVPTEIVNPQSVYATLEIDGQRTTVDRLDNTYTASSTAEPGNVVNLEAQIIDTIQGTSLLLASFSGTATPIANGTLQLQSFSTQHDADNDGVLNYQELAQGTDPFSVETQCTPVTETIFANLTDDAYVQNSRIQNNNRLQVDGTRRVSLIRFQFDNSESEVTAASLNMTVGTDAGNGLLTVAAIAGFDWSDQGGNITVPTGDVAASVENDWEQGVAYSFPLSPTLIAGDTTFIVRQSSGNDVGFQSSDTIDPPTLELTLERCE